MYDYNTYYIVICIIIIHITENCEPHFNLRLIQGLKSHPKNKVMSFEGAN